MYFSSLRTGSSVPGILTHVLRYYEYLLFAEPFQTGILQMKLLQLIVIENNLRFYLLKSVFST